MSITLPDGSKAYLMDSVRDIALNYHRYIVRPGQSPEFAYLTAGARPGVGDWFMLATGSHPLQVEIDMAHMQAGLPTPAAQLSQAAGWAVGAGLFVGSLFVPGPEDVVIVGFLSTRVGAAAATQGSKLCRVVIEIVPGVRRLSRSGSSGARTVAGVASRQLDDVSSSVYHYTGADEEILEKMWCQGLRPGTYTSPNGTLSPLQAQLDLALPPVNHRFPNPSGVARLPHARFEVDLDRLRSCGVDIPDPGLIARYKNMPGGGTEIQFPPHIPPEAIKGISMWDEALGEWIQIYSK